MFLKLYILVISIFLFVALAINKKINVPKIIYFSNINFFIYGFSDK